MKKYTLQRLESLALATFLSITLTACGDSETNDGFQETIIALENANNDKDAIISDYELENASLSKEVEELKEELNRKKAEIESLSKKADSYASLISREKALKLLDESNLYDKETKEFIKNFLSTKSEKTQISLLLQVVTGDSRYLAGYISENNAHVPLTPIYDSKDLFILDNTKGAIGDFSALYVNLRFSHTYGNYNVYETKFGFIITDSNNMVVAYTTTNGITSISDLDISIVSFNKFLESIGLPQYVSPEYLPENLERARLAINKRIAQYHTDGNRNGANVIVIDMSSRKEYSHIGEHASYYFLDYIGPDVFNTSRFLYLDIFNNDGYFTLDRESEEFIYQYPDFYSSSRSFYLTEYDFYENPLKPLSTLLSEKNMSDNYKNVLNNAELNDIYAALNSEEPLR